MDELVTRAQQLRAEGLTPTNIMTRFRDDAVPLHGEPHEWTRPDILKLLAGDTATVGASMEPMRQSDPEPVVRTTPTPAAPSWGSSYAPRAASEYGLARALSMCLKVFGVFALFGAAAVGKDYEDSAAAFAGDGFGMAFWWFVGFINLVLWWTAAVVIDLLRDIARK